MRLRKHIRIGRPAPGTVLGTAALVVALGGVASGAIPDGGGKISGCYVTATGQLRVIDTEAAPAPACKNSEKSLTWSQAGPAGPTGPAGPAGPAGKDALADVHVAMHRATEAFVAPGAVALGGARCNAGEHATGGGVVFDDGGQTGDAVVGSWPQGNPTLPTPPDDGASPIGWVAEIRNGGTTPRLVRYYAICVAS